MQKPRGFTFEALSIKGCAPTGIQLEEQSDRCLTFSFESKYTWNILFQVYAFDIKWDFRQISGSHKLSLYNTTGAPLLSLEVFFFPPEFHILMNKTVASEYCREAAQKFI